MADPQVEKIVNPTEQPDEKKKSVELDEKDLKEVSGGAGVLIVKDGH